LISYGGIASVCEEQEFALQLINSSTIAIQTGGCNGSGGTFSLQGYPVNDGLWHLYDATFDGTTLAAYVDGQQVGSSSAGIHSTSVPGFGLQIGTAGDLAEAAVYPSALSPDRIAAHWTRGSSHATSLCVSPPTSIYSQAVLADSPAVYLRLGDTVGLSNDPSPDRVAFDSSGSCHNGAYNLRNAYKQSGALFGDPDGAITSPTPAAGLPVIESGATLPAGQAARTAEIWARTTDTGAGNLITYGGITSVCEEQVFAVGLAPSTVRVDTGGCNGSGAAFSVASPLNDGRWHLVDVTFDGTTLVAYVDGQPVGSSAAGIHSTSVPGFGLLVGGMVGDVDEAAVYPTALSSARIWDHWKKGANRAGETVLAWGTNSSGQLGNGTTTDSGVPVPVSLPVGTTIASVAAGGTFSLALTSTGSVLAWGDNSFGQLGNGTTINSSVPVVVSLPSGTIATAIAAGENHSLAVTSTGSVLAWGDNSSGQLGNGTTTNSLVPVPVSLPPSVPPSPTVFDVAAGAAHSLAVTSNGLVLAWGDNSAGQLGDGTTTNSDVPVYAKIPANNSVTAVSASGSAGFDSLAVTDSGSVFAWGSLAGSTVPVAIGLPAGTAAIAIAMSGFPENTGFAVTATGSVFAWGRGPSPIPVPVSLPNGTFVTSVAAGGTQAIFVTMDGHVLTLSGTSAAPFALPLSATANSVAAGGAFNLAILGRELLSATSLTSTPNPSLVGQEVRLGATVTALRGVTLDAFCGIEFLDGTTSLGFARFGGPGGGGTVTQNLSVGTHSITAVCLGSADFQGSISAPISQVVNQLNTPTSTTLNSGVNPSVFGQPTTLTATVQSASGIGTPSGSVQFFDGTAAIGSATLDPSGAAALATSSLAVGTHSLTAVYAGDTAFNSSTSPPLSQVVNQAATSVSLAADANPIREGQTATFTATLTVTSPGNGAPTGTVTFEEGAVTLGTAPLGVGGKATLPLATLIPGSHSIVGVYGGDVSFAGSTSPPFVQVVNAAVATVVVLQSSANPSVFGQAINFTATVTPASPSTLTPSGSVTYSEGGTVLGSAKLDSTAQAVLTLSNLTLGSHSITASYGGDTVFNVASSTPLTQAVNQASTTTAVEASPNPDLVNQVVTITATVAPISPGSGTPTGIVTFVDGPNTLGTAALGTNFSAKLSTTSLAVGNHTITATYSGDGNFTPSTSVGFIETINLATVTFTNIASDLNPAVLGQPVTFTATVSSAVSAAGTPVGTVSFSDGSTSLGTGTLNNLGVATLTVTTLGVGAHSITASYSGTTAFTPSSSNALVENVTATAASTTTLTADNNQALFSQTVTFTATVTSPLAGTPTGTIIFRDGSSVLGTVALDTGASARLSVSTLGVGSHNVTAGYSGDSKYSASTSTGLAETITPAESLVFVTIPNAFIAGTTSGLITVQLRDVTGAPVAAGSGGLNVLLDHSSGLGHFRDTADGADITDVLMPAGTSTVSFRYLDTFAGQAILKAASDPATGIASASITVTITAAALDHLVLAPATATASVGSGRTYTAEGFDALGNDIGDQTTSAVFTISPDGSCTASLCTLASIGPHMVTATAGTATGSATLIGDIPPVPNLVVVNGVGVAPQVVTFDVSAAYTGSQPLTYTLDFGDGSQATGSLPVAAITHTYASACQGCTVILTVSDGIASPAPDAISSVEIAPGIPPKSIPGDPVTIVLGTAAHLDGSSSVPAPPGITTYHWDFGDGTSAEGAVQDHIYPGPAPKDWTASLTVSGLAGSNTANVLVHVIPPPAVKGLVVSVTGDGLPLTGALVAVEDANNNTFHAVETSGGSYRIDGLNDGAFTVYAYKAGFVPNVGSAKVLAGSGTATIALTSGQFATSQIVVNRLTAQQAQALGIDTTLPGNQNVFQFEIHLAFIPDQPVVVGGIIAPAIGLMGISSNGSDWHCTAPCLSPIPLGNGALAFPRVATVNNGTTPVLIWMIIPGKAKWLKEFFQVQFAITNLAPTPISFQDGSSTLNLPSGLSLADLNPGLSPQSLTQQMPDIPGMSTQTANWLIRGDAEGFYNLSADYRAALQPFGLPVQLHAETATPLHVWGGSALHMTVDADDHAYSDPPASWPYHVRVSLTNVADVPVYNPMIELMPLPDGDPRRNYLFQPREQFDQFTDRIDPGQTFTSRDYIVAPNFVPATLDLADTFVLKTGGNTFIPSTIISHPATPPVDVPRLEALTQGGSTQLFWDPIPGAIAYQVFSTPDFQHSFPTTFLTQVDGTQVGTALPATPFGEIALSTVILGSDGAIHNVMFHYLTQAQGFGLPDPCTAYGWDPYGGTIGNFVYSTTDQRVNTPGPRLELTRTYNSNDTHVGAFGAGWHFTYEMSWEPGANGSVVVHYPDGRCEVYQKQADGSLAPPPGYTSTLKPDGLGGYVLTQKDRVAYTFAPDGTLQSIADSNGRNLVLSYDTAGHLARVTDTASGRYLAFGWTASSITSVATNPVSGQGSLTWRYYYSGSVVTSACDPRNNLSTGFCSKYTYTGGVLTSVTKPAGNFDIKVTYGFDGKMNSKTDGSGNTTLYEYPTPTVVRTINPLGNATVTEYDGLYRVARQVDAAGNAKSYVYDANGFRTEVIDANGNLARMTYDGTGNLTSKTDGEGNTTYLTYDAFGQVTVSRDPRSASATDNTYATTYTYDSAGNRLSETLPATPGFSTGTTRRWTYSTGNEIGVDGGRLPAGLLLTDTDAAGNQTTYSYDSKGNLRQVVDRAGLKTTYTYDEIGRRMSSTVFDSDLSSAGAITTFAYDKISDLVSVTEPAVLNPVTGVTHQRRTVNTFDANRNLVQVRVEDATGADGARLTTYAYDANDRQVKMTDPLGGVTTRHYNSVGKVDMEADANGRISTTSYDVRDLPVAVTIINFVDDPTVPSPPRNVVVARYTYDAAGRLSTQSDALGRLHRFAYDRADRQISETLVGFHNRDGSLRDVVLSQTSYDAASNPILQTTGNGEKTVANQWDAAGKLTRTTLDPGRLNRITSYMYDANGNVTGRSVTDGVRTETAGYTYDPASRPLSESIDNGTTTLTTTYAYDLRGNAITVVDPRGNLTGATASEFTTSFAYDAVNRRISQTDPPVLVQQGSVTSIQRRVTEYGFDTFGNQTQVKDRRGNVTTTMFDALDRIIKVAWPTYVRPDGVTINAAETYAYDAVGNRIRVTDRRGNSTNYVYDSLDRLVVQIDPLVTGEAARGTIHYVYNDVGDRTSVTDQVGATTEFTYDDFDRVRTTTQVVRNASPLADRFTTTYDYDDLGNQTYLADPLGAITQSTYSPASELVRQVDPLGRVTSFSYDVGSRLVRRTDALGRFTIYTYDLGGRLIAKTNNDSGGTPVATTSYSYDAAGNQTTVTTPLGNATTPSFSTTYTFDPGNRLTQVDLPVSASVSIRTSYQYDAENNLTTVVDGRANGIQYTYTSWNQLQDAIEPSTPGQPTLADRTFTEIYDSGGLSQTELQPGGITITRTYDQLDRLRTEVGSGGAVPGARRTFGYDLTGNLTAVSHPVATINIEHDNRGLITAVTGGAGASSFSYDAAGRLVQRTDGAGTSAFTWTARGELASATDPLTGVTRAYGYDAAGQLTSVSYGAAPAPNRALTYDALGRLLSDDLKGSSGAQLAGYQYAYDANSNVTSEAIALPGNLQSGTHTFTYDFANQLTSWTSALTGTTTYEYDASGNRTRAGTATYTFDARNRLVLGAGALYKWSPNGTLRSVATGVAKPIRYTFDALGRLANYNGQVQFTYDGLGRIAQRGNSGFTYEGTELNAVTDDTSTYALDPSGALIAAQTAGLDAIIGHDRHGDVSYTFSARGIVNETTVYDPFGVPIGHNGGITVHAGFQGDFTDPSAGTVDMGARWYAPGIDTFLSQDAVSGSNRDPLGRNRFTYAVDNPLAFYDPNGRDAIPLGSQSFVENALSEFAAVVANAKLTLGSNLSTQSAQQLATQSTLGTALRGNVQASDAARQSALSAGTARAACVMNPNCFYHVPVPQPEVILGSPVALFRAIESIPAGIDSALLSVPGIGGAFSVTTGVLGYDPILGRELSQREQIDRQRQGVDDLIGFVPIVGSLYQIGTAAWGYDQIVERNLTAEERIQRAAFSFPGLRSLFPSVVRQEARTAEQGAFSSTRATSTARWSEAPRLAAPAEFPRLAAPAEFPRLAATSELRPVPAIGAPGAAPQAGGDFVSVFHGSLDNSTSILENGLEASRGSTMVSRDIEAARDAIGPNHVAYPGRDPGIIESRIPAAEFNRVLLRAEREYHGFYPYELESTEIVLRTQEAFDLFNRYIVR